MKKPALLVYSGMILLAVFSCNQPGDQKIQAPNKIFSISEFILKQELILGKSDITVNKISNIDGKNEEVFFKPDSVFWQKEFEVFSSADIGKPALRDRYVSSELDSSGYKIIKYESLNPGMNGIPWMKVSKDRTGMINEITIKKQEKNFLYQSTRILALNLEYDPDFSEGIIKSYSIQGSQKVIFRNRIQYEVLVNLDRAK